MTLEQRIEALEKNLVDMKAQNESLRESTTRALDDLNAHASCLAAQVAYLEARTSNNR